MVYTKRSLVVYIFLIFIHIACFWLIVVFFSVALIVLFFSVATKKKKLTINAKPAMHKEIYSTGIPLVKNRSVLVYLRRDRILSLKVCIYMTPIALLHFHPITNSFTIFHTYIYFLALLCVS